MRRGESSIPLSEETKAEMEKQVAFLAQQGLTEETFQGTVQEKMDGRGLSFVLAVYQTFEEFLEKETKTSKITLACKDGCSGCCHTLITSTEMEIDEVIGFINHLSREVRMPLVKRAVNMAREWRDYYNGNEFQIKLDPSKPFRDWQKPCPFLDGNGTCEVYPVRIVDCRTLTNLTPCTFSGVKTVFFAGLHAEGPVRYRFRCETWATNLIMERLQKKMRLSDPILAPVTPVLHWLYMKRKEMG